MPNTFFTFKQFTINQENAAMKVCTDSCLFGAWLARQVPGAKKVLDVGAGTGLLSLMYAQENREAVIDAVEIDPQAAAQAEENFGNSPWASRLSVHAADIRDYSYNGQYDLIFSNPPFYENDLRSLQPARNNAMHDASFTLDQFGKIIARYLSPNGKFAVLLPYRRQDDFIEKMQSEGFYLSDRLLIKQSLSHTYFRSILCFTKHPVVSVSSEEMYIKEEDGRYSPAFVELLKDYYLYL